MILIRQQSDNYNVHYFQLDVGPLAWRIVTINTVSFFIKEQAIIPELRP